MVIHSSDNPLRYLQSLFVLVIMMQFHVHVQNKPSAITRSSNNCTLSINYWSGCDTLLIALLHCTNPSALILYSG